MISSANHILNFIMVQKKDGLKKNIYLFILILIIDSFKKG